MRALPAFFFGQGSGDAGVFAITIENGFVSYTGDIPYLAAVVPQLRKAFWAYTLPYPFQVNDDDGEIVTDENGELVIVFFPE